MSVPESIRSVERPVNTVVVDNGRDGPNRWAVRERAFVRYVPGMKNPQPHSGKTVGHIIDGRFVPIKEPLRNADGVLMPDCLQYGFGSFVKNVVDDIRDDLLDVFPARSAYEILAISTLRVIEPGVPDKRLRYFYDKSVVSLHYPGIFLSARSVHNLFEEIGSSLERRSEFARRRVERVSADHHIVVDGMLKQDNGTINDLGSYTHKSRVKGRAEVSILYAYDVEAGEVICGEVFPGNFVDSNAYVPFIEHNHITRGIIIDDKGFPPSVIAPLLKEHPDLHFMTPLKRNDTRIERYHMTEFEGVLSGFGRPIFYKKMQIAPDRFLYAFRDPRRAEAEEILFGNDAAKNGKFDSEKYARKRETAGLIVFEADVDIPPGVAYSCYDDRWYIELVFREYKSILDLDETRCQGDFTVIGSDFVNTIASIITTRLLREIRKTDLFDKFTYRDITVHLKSAWRQVNAPPPVTGDRYWIHTNKEDALVLEKLGLATPDPSKQPKKRSQRSDLTPARGHGGDCGESAVPAESGVVKRGPGRPRIHPPKDPNAPKRPRGRPRREGGTAPSVEHDFKGEASP